MVEQDKLSKWAIGLEEECPADEQTEKFLDCSRLAWPRVLAHTRHELSNQRLNADEISSLTLEIWERTLRSAWKTLQQSRNREDKIVDLQNYLIGIFHHRLNRHLKRRRLRDSMLEFRPATELAKIKGAENIDEDCLLRIQRSIQLKQACTAMNDEMRRAVIARLCGFSWKEIAEDLQIEEQRLIMRVRYAIQKVRGKFARTPLGKNER